MSSEPQAFTVTHSSRLPKTPTILDHWDVLSERLRRPRDTERTEQGRRDSVLAYESWKAFAGEIEGLTCIFSVFAHYGPSSSVDIGVFKGMVHVAQERVDRYRDHWPTSCHFCVTLRDLCFAFIDSFEQVFEDTSRWLLEDDEAELKEQLGALHSLAQDINMHAHKTLEVIQGHLYLLEQ